MKEAKKLNLLLTLCLWSILGLAGMVLMFKTASEKTVIIPDVTRAEEGMAGFSKEEGASEPFPGSILKLVQDERSEGIFQIPLPGEAKAENITMENRYIDKELWIHVEEAGTDFFEENAICGDVEGISHGFCEEKRSGVILKLRMERVLEYYSIIENNELKISFEDPKDIYEQIVIIDPIGGGDPGGLSGNGIEEKELALQVAKLLYRMEFPREIRLYFTRLEDVEVTEEKRLSLAEAVDADLYIRLRAWEDWENPRRYGIRAFYNEEYYIPEFGNVELADMLTRGVTISASNRAEGLFGAEQDSLLKKLQMPAAEICLGYLSNETESRLLAEEYYQRRLAEGIANAILEIYAGEEAEAD